MKWVAIKNLIHDKHQISRIFDIDKLKISINKSQFSIIPYDLFFNFLLAFTEPSFFLLIMFSSNFYFKPSTPTQNPREYFALYFSYVNFLFAQVGSKKAL